MRKSLNLCMRPVERRVGIGVGKTSGGKIRNWSEEINGEAKLREKLREKLRRQAERQTKREVEREVEKTS